jgi:hypothetical protein
MFKAIKDNVKASGQAIATAVYEKPAYDPFMVASPATQKAKGIMFLQENHHAVNGAPNVNMTINKHLLFPSGTQFTDASFNYPVFARPCPTVPRHGFVDSVVCKDANELNAVSLETHKVESDAEVLVTKPIKSAYNCIITGGVITFAEGNDGATSGKNVKYFYINDDPIGDAINLDKSVLLEGELPFYEIVMSDHNSGDFSHQPYLVQVRSAPGMPASKNFIPQEIKVENIIKAGGDLLEWESKVKAIDPTNTIIDHEGGSLASHFSIHAVVNNVAIFTEDVPKIGDIVAPNAESSEITDEHRQKFKNAFFHAFSYAPTLVTKNNTNYNKTSIGVVMGNIVKIGLATIHNYAALNKHKDYELLGHVMGLFVKTIFSVSMGEARYAHGKIGSIPSIYKDITSHGKGRDFCYRSMVSSDVTKAIYDIHRAFFVFDAFKWGGSFGGKKWASCTRSAIELYNSCIEGDIVSIVEKFNKVIHESHNGGPYLNKIINPSEFDKAADNPANYAVKNLNNIVDILNSVNNAKSKIKYNEDDFSMINLKLKPFHLIGKESKSVHKPYNSSDIIKLTVIKSTEFAPNSYNLTFRLDFSDGYAVKLIKGDVKTDQSVSIFDGQNLDKIPHWFAINDCKIISKKAINQLLRSMNPLVQKSKVLSSNLK